MKASALSVHTPVRQNKNTAVLLGVFTFHTSWVHMLQALSAKELSIEKCSNTSCDQQIGEKEKTHTDKEGIVLSSGVGLVRSG